jgi:hypothetical protein
MGHNDQKMEKKYVFHDPPQCKPQPAKRKFICSGTIQHRALSWRRTRVCSSQAGMSDALSPSSTWASSSASAPPMSRTPPAASDLRGRTKSQQQPPDVPPAPAAALDNAVFTMHIVSRLRPAGEQKGHAMR